jgi:hypothetical protein
MDDEQPQTGMAASLSVFRAGVVLVVFVAAVALLVSVPSSAPTTTPTTPTTAGAAGASSTTTTAPPSSTTTTAAHGHKAAKGSKSTTTTTTIAPSSVSVVVANATSVNGLAAHYTTVIGAGGWKMGTPSDAATTEATSAVYYAAGFQEPAATIATAIGVKPTQVLPLTTATPVTGATGVDVVVVIGQDLASTTTASS